MFKWLVNVIEFVKAKIELEFISRCLADEEVDNEKKLMSWSEQNDSAESIQYIKSLHEKVVKRLEEAKAKL